ncbi:MAG: geranylgeranylglyceryl/heptaprenylglyceryl phosphate synthase [Nanoarchaeota archaeon]|nr:geranylgeranylglyceryl/heptaprenylglyceryl phosphate synthase [Nanoarchaeota archaeon]
MKIGKTEARINSLNDQGKGVFMGLIDPAKQPPENGAKLAKRLEEGGADVIMLGGSIGAQGPVLDDLAKRIKESVSVPLHIFPGNVSNVTPYADSIYFMSLMNSKNPYWITGAQTLGSLVVRQLGLEPIPTAYLIFDPGQTAGWVGEAHLLPREKPDLAIAYTLSAQYMGMRFAILEAGSGAPEHVPLPIIKAIREVSDIKLVIAGGVKTPEQAGNLIKAGANCIHIGTKIEQEGSVEAIRKFARAIHGEG